MKYTFGSMDAELNSILIIAYDEEQEYPAAEFCWDDNQCSFRFVDLSQDETEQIWLFIRNNFSQVVEKYELKDFFPGYFANKVVKCDSKSDKIKTLWEVGFITQYDIRDICRFYPNDLKVDFVTASNIDVTHLMFLRHLISHVTGK